VPPAPTKLPGVSLVEEGSADMIPGVDLPAVVEGVSKPTGVDMGGPQADPLQVDAVFDDAVFEIALADGLETYALNEPIDEPEAASPKAGMAARNPLIGSSHKRMFLACKVTSTKLHWLRLLLPLEPVTNQWHLLRCPLST
jgi:hypothetical protein